ncbi:nucleotide sugar dehydrogenase [Bacillus fonticola]|uniref:nucleotide sugar dehydrogenase n=1 Tax=Bacillus fonticola TaxID=2728853 RepID=UPI001476737F|nr:nucleotide sugar dehydrogenase [Bacillus fonticola]
MKKICVIGLGYIGLPTSAVFARAGFDVVGMDVSQHVVDTLNRGDIHIEEEGLAEVVKEVVANGKLRASTKPEEADVYIISVPTPVHADHTANLDYVVAATNSIVPYVQKGSIVLVESTIPPRTMDDVVAPIITAAGFSLEDVHLAHIPERVIPGRIMIELIENTRIVGGVTPEAAKKAADVYRTIVQGECIETEALTAEMSKLMENTYRDVNIALANELVKVSGKLGVNAQEVISLANRHPRVNIHQPGPGVGGHCIAVDPYFIIEKATEEAQLMKMARDINNSMPSFVCEQVARLTAEINNPTITLFGLTYKGNVDDVRESPSLEIAEMLENTGAYTIRYHDPHVRQEQVAFPLSNFEDSVKDSHLILVLTDHNEFKTMDSEKLQSLMKSTVVFDTKNCVEMNDERVQVVKIGNLSELKAIQA